MYTPWKVYIVPSRRPLNKPLIVSNNFPGYLKEQRTLRGGPWVTLRCGGTIPRRVRPRGYRFQRLPAERSEAVPPSEARLHRAKRGSTERSEAPPSKARLHRAKRGSTEAPPSEARPREGHRHYKKTQKGSTRKPRGTTYFKLKKNFGKSCDFFLTKVAPEHFPEFSRKHSIGKKSSGKSSGLKVPVFFFNEKTVTFFFSFYRKC